MALFGSKRDARFLKSITREVMRKIISIEVGIFKIALTETEMNLYSESNKKVYYHPIYLFSLVNKEDTATTGNDTGIDVTKTVTFAFLRDDLLNIDLVLSRGDIIKFNEQYYEIDNIRDTQYWMGRNPETLPMQVENRINRDYGYNISIVAETHLARSSQLNLIETRSGINSNKISNIPKNL